MGKNSSQGVFRRAAANQTPGYKNESTGRGECVDIIGVQNNEMITAEYFRFVRGCRERLSKRVDVLIDLRVRVSRIFRKDNGADGPADIVFLLRCEVFKASGNGHGAFADGFRLGMADNPGMFAYRCGQGSCRFNRCAGRNRKQDQHDQPGNP